MRPRLILITIAIAAAAIPFSPSTAHGAPDKGGQPAHATFEGRTIDLSQPWGAAQACLVADEGSECFRTEAAMLAAHPEIEGDPVGELASAASSLVLAATCSTSLRLYRSPSFGGQVLALTTRAVVLNLSIYGFDNDTSSYRVGACSSTFFSAASGGGSIYPGPTGAFASASAMLPGWDNVISSVLIN